MPKTRRAREKREGAFKAARRACVQSRGPRALGRRLMFAGSGPLQRIRRLAWLLFFASEMLGPSKCSNTSGEVRRNVSATHLADSKMPLGYFSDEALSDGTARSAEMPTRNARVPVKIK